MDYRDSHPSHFPLSGPSIAFRFLTGMARIHFPSKRKRILSDIGFLINLCGARGFHLLPQLPVRIAVLNLHRSHCDERAQPVHWHRALVFDSVAAFDVLSFAFLEQMESTSNAATESKTSAR